jgi:glycosyltransferase involved in cell wall biosynthesis
MKILCVIDSLCPGGAQRQMVELALGFKEMGNEVTFLIYHNIPFFTPDLEDAGIQITCINEPNYLRRFLKMRTIIRKGKYDSVLSFLEAPSFICELSGFPYRKWKLIVGERSANPLIFKSLKRIIYRQFHLLADYIVANSHSNINYVRKVNPFLSKSKCRVIYNIVDFEYWQPPENFVLKNHSKLKLIISARQNYLKNLSGLVEALALMNREELDKISVEWYGDSITEPYHDNSFTEANEKIRQYKLQNVLNFYPASPDFVKIAREADAVGLFSFYEGFPNTILEGMACGKPIICTAVSDLPDLLNHNEKLLCDPYNPYSIRKALSYLINLTSGELEQIGNRNLQIVKEKFNRELILSEYLSLFGKTGSQHPEPSTIEPDKAFNDNCN